MWSPRYRHTCDCPTVYPVSTAVLVRTRATRKQRSVQRFWQRATAILVGGLRSSAHGRFEPLRFLYRFDGAFCWKPAIVPAAASAVVFSGRCDGRAAVARLETIHLLARTSGVRTSACRWKFVWLRPNCSRLDMKHFAELRRICKSSLRYRRLVPAERPDLPTTSKVIICRSLRSCSTSSCVRPVKGRSEGSQFFDRGFPLKILCSPYEIFTASCFQHFMY